MTVDLEIEAVGTGMRNAIGRMFKADIYNTPSEISEVFEAIFADLCVGFGWYEDADGNWWRSPVKGFLE